MGLTTMAIGMFSQWLSLTDTWGTFWKDWDSSEKSMSSIHWLRVWWSYLHIPVGNTSLSTLCWVHFIGNLTCTKISLLGRSGLMIWWPQMKQKEFWRVSHPLFTKNKNLVHWLLWSEHDPSYGNYKVWCVMRSLWAPRGTLEMGSCPTDVLVEGWLVQVKQIQIQQVKGDPETFENYLQGCIHHWPILV